MNQPLFRKPETPDFGNPAIQQAFVQRIQDSHDLIQAELSVNQSEQILLLKRIEMTKEFVNHLPASDPQYSLLLIQIKMDQVELDELKAREIILSNHSK